MKFYIFYSAVLMILIAPMAMKSYAQTPHTEQRTIDPASEHIALTYLTLIGADPDIEKMASRNLSTSAKYTDMRKEANRLQDQLAKLDPHVDYIVVKGFSPFSASVGPNGERFFHLSDFNANFTHTSQYQKHNYMVVVPSIEEFKSIDLDEHAISQFMASYQQSGLIAYTAHIQAAHADPEPMILDNETKYRLIAGNVAALTLFDNYANPIWSYQTRNFGLTKKDELKELYYKDEKETRPAIESVNREIKDLYQQP